MLILERSKSGELEFHDSEPGGLELLARDSFHDAIFDGVSDNQSEHGPDPILRIVEADGTRRVHYGTLKYDSFSSPRIRDTSNDIRQEFIDRGLDVGLVRVRIFDLPEGRDVREPYSFFAGEGYSLSSKDALSVVRGDTVFFARYSFTHSRGNPALSLYFLDGRRGFGYLEPTRSNLYRDDVLYSDTLESLNRTYAESKITNEQIQGLKPGDYLLVRKVAQNREGTTLFFEPVVNFSETDKVLSPTGQELVTHVEGYNSGDIIYNLPIIMGREDKESPTILVGVGRVIRPQDEQESFPYKPVYVKGAGKDVGKYIAEARIIKNGTGIILAEKVN